MECCARPRRANEQPCRHGRAEYCMFDSCCHDTKSKAMQTHVGAKRHEKNKTSPQAGSNHRPFAYEASALPLSYRGYASCKPIHLTHTYKFTNTRHACRTNNTEQHKTNTHRHYTRRTHCSHSPSIDRVSTLEAAAHPPGAHHRHAMQLCCTI